MAADEMCQRFGGLAGVPDVSSVCCKMLLGALSQSLFGGLQETLPHLLMGGRMADSSKCISMDGLTKRLLFYMFSGLENSMVEADKETPQRLLTGGKM